MTDYYSDRTHGPVERDRLTLTVTTARALIALVDAAINQDGFAEAFPLLCPDGNAIAGTDFETLWSHMQGCIPGLRMPLRSNAVDPVVDDSIYDLLEYVADRVSAVTSRRPHEFFGHDHLSLDDRIGAPAFRREVNELLARGGIAYHMTPSFKIDRIVGDELQAAFDLATSREDAVSAELKEAWANAFGRKGDPSDAWDHAIKALEDLLIPIVVPNKSRATLGDVLGLLRSQNSVWKLILPGKDRDHCVVPLVKMLEIIWPNHDRHGGGHSPKRPPSVEEAKAVVTLAATIVQWQREGWVVRRRNDS